MAGITIDVEALHGIKMLRETLCSAQSAIIQNEKDQDQKDADIRRLGDLIKQLDQYRPLGSDGKHGDRHTLFCGCNSVKKLLERTPFVA